MNVKLNPDTGCSEHTCPTPDKGCGVCGASCPQNAITIHHFTSDQIIAEIVTYGGGE